MRVATKEAVAPWPQGRLVVWLASTDLLGLAATTALVAAGLVIRVRHTHRGTYLFLLWNLALAWLPALLAQFAVLASRARRNWMVPVGLGALWLALFPNAPYVITDLIHLRPAPDVPLWFDAGLLFAAGWTGLALGFHSLDAVRSLVATTLRPRWGAAFTLTALGLASIGVQLGRFERWNSWDLLSNPGSIVGDLARAFTDPNALGFELCFSAPLVCGYWAWTGSHRVH